LIALDEHRNFIKAAEACFVTQPTLSMQIKKLEDELGVLLFDRSRQPIMSTEIGKKVIAQARIIAKETNLIKDILADFKGNIGGTLKIGIIPTIASSLLPNFIKVISKNYPELRLDIKELLTHEIVDELQNDKLDFGIVSTPLNDSSIIEEHLYSEKFKVFLNEKHPGYNKETISSEDLLLDKLWLLSEGNCFRTQTLNLCTFNPTQFQQFALEYESGSLYTLRKIVEIEGGATILPQWECILLSEKAKKSIRNFEDQSASRDVGIIYTKHYAKESVINKVKNLIIQAIPQEIKKNQSLRAVAFN
jgi:LysR family hydrogen peroxide-inducible transcriptional activator